MNRPKPRHRVIEFLATISRPDQPVEALEGTANLVEAGLVDSFAILEIISFLEAEFGIDFEAGGINPDDVASIDNILALIESKTG